MKKHLLVLMLLGTLLLPGVGCKEKEPDPIFHNSSITKIFDYSKEGCKSVLKEQDKAKFDAAFQQIVDHYVAQNPTLKKADAEQLAYQAMDRKNAKEIIKMAEELAK